MRRGPPDDTYSIGRSVRRRRLHQEPLPLTEAEQRALDDILRGRRRPEEEVAELVVRRDRHPAYEVVDEDDEDDDDDDDDYDDAGDAGDAGDADDEEPDRGEEAGRQEDGPRYGSTRVRFATAAMRNVIAAMQEVGIISPPGNEGQEEVNLPKFLQLWNNTVQGNFIEGNANYVYIQRRLAMLFPPRNGGNVPSNVIQFIIGHGQEPHLRIPLNNAFDISLMLFFFILYKLSTLNPGYNYFLKGVVGNLQAPQIPLGVVYIDQYQGNVLLSQIMLIFSFAADIFQQLFQDPEARTETEEWEDLHSGEVFRLGGRSPVDFYLLSDHGRVLRIGGYWDNALEGLISSVFPRGGIACIRNETDNLCLLYSIAMGVVYDSMHNFFTREKFVDVNSLSRRIDALRLESHENAKDIMFKIRQRIPGDSCDRIENLALKDYSTRGICEEIEKIEKEFLRPFFALDVYIMDYSVTMTRRIYPCYISARKTAHRISVLNISFNKTSHYCLITNMREVFAQTGGKIFFTCSKCHKTYYSKQMEIRHENCLERDESEWHWDSAGVGDEHEEFGRCEKCHLKFCSLERYEFHKKHCFMKNRSGSRIVTLVKEPVLSGGGTEETLDDKFILFADFECCISESGEHSFMSFGLYDVTAEAYTSGLDMDSFMKCLEEIAFGRERDIYVFFHNAMNYDVNFILQFVLANRRSWSISVIMKSASRLQSVRFCFEKQGKKKKIIIGDTVHFLTMSLSKIVNSIRKDSLILNEAAFPLFFKEMGKRYSWLSHEDFDKVLRKNLFPYRYFEVPARLGATIENFARIFEPREENLKYFSEGLTVHDLEENLPLFQEICRKFRVRDAYDYHSIYLLCDVMQISDVFLKARESLFGTHKIDIAKYIGMPGASWSAFLKMNPEMKLPLYTETRFAEFFSSMTRGGVTSAPLRFAKSDATHSILYLDVNGLYPYVMKEYKYPMGEMKWRTFEIDQGCNAYLLNNYFPYLEDNGKGACLCVDLCVSEALKESTDQFPFAPEHKILKDCFFDRDGEMYPFLKKWSAANNGEQMKPFVGLVGTLYNKKEYGVHWQLLKWYIQHGLFVSKIHFAVEFDEGDYLKKYVSLNIEIRNKRHDELGKMVYKLLGNSIYGKTFESPFNRGNYMIVRDPEKMRGILEDGNISSITPIGSDGYIVKLDAEEVILDKPTYIGACVTEYAKLHMYKLFYDELERIFPGIELVYTDTDSFIIRVPHERDMSAPELFQYIEDNAPGLIGSIGGQVKSETGEDVIDEVIALRSKLYAYKTKSGKIGKRAKGTTAAAQESELSWDVYKEALVDLRAVPTHNVQFQRRAFHVRTVELLKQSISVNDGKRFICEDGIHTHAWGY